MKLVSLICLIYLIYPVIANAEDICFSEDVAKQLTIDLEKCQVIKEQIELSERYFQ